MHQGIDSVQQGQGIMQLVRREATIAWFTNEDLRTTEQTIVQHTTEMTFEH